MKYLTKLGELADRFEIKLSLAQTSSAQAGDIEKALRDAGAFPMPDALSPYLNTAKVPENVSLNIGVVVDPKLNVRFNVGTSPTNPSGANLARLLDSKFAPSMSQALKSAKLGVAETVQVPVATF